MNDASLKVEEIAHAKLSASGSSRWMNCAAAPSREAGIPDKGSKFAAEGTAAHELGAMCLGEGKRALEFLGGEFTVEGLKFAVDDEMVLSVQTYIDKVLENVQSKEHLLVERRVDFSPWVSEGFGTSDAIVVDGTTLEVHDLKYGKGVQVYAEGNSQLMLYGLGSYNDYSMLEDFTHVKLCIHQPRLNHYDEFTLTIEELMAFGLEVKAAAEATLIEDVVATSGEVQCKWCKAQAICLEYAADVQEIIGMDFAVVGGDTTAVDFRNITGEQLSCYYHHIDFIESWCKAIKAKTLDTLSEGQKVPGYKLVQGKLGNRAWVNEEEATATLKGMRLKVEERCNLKTKSPTQIEKVLKKDHPKQWKKLQNHITRSEGKPCIALESDKRLAISVSDDFEQLTD
jgi:hypothetical protein